VLGVPADASDQFEYQIQPYPVRPVPVFSDLETRVTEAPFDREAYERRLPGARDVADRVHLVHVSGVGKDGKGIAFDSIIQNPPQEIPTSDDLEYYDDSTRCAEKLLGLAPSGYFYAGRAHPDFGNVALAFAPECEANHTGSATPFDTGGLLHPSRYIKVKFDPNDDEAERVRYGKASEISLEDWRDVFGGVLAAYFEDHTDYWHGRPKPYDLQGLYELNDDCRAWTFEVRFHEGQSIHDRAAWCADEPVMNQLRRLDDQEALAPPGDSPTPLQQFFQGPPALESSGTPHYCPRLERWIRDEIGL